MIAVQLTPDLSKSLTMPSSVAADEESGGDGVEDLKDEAPDDESTEGGLWSWPLMFRAWCGPPAAAVLVMGEHESFMRSMAAEHSVMVSSQSEPDAAAAAAATVSLVRRLRDLKKKPVATTIHWSLHSIKDHN